MNLIRFNRKLIFPIVIIIICIITLIFIISSHDINISLFRFRYLGIYFIISCFYLFIASIRTPIILDSKEYLKSFLLHRMSMVSGSASPIKVGVPIKIYLFKKYLGISAIQSTSAILFEVIIRIFILIIMGMILGSWRYLIVVDPILLSLFVFIICILFFYTIKLKTKSEENTLISSIKTKIISFKQIFKEKVLRYDISIKIVLIQIIIQLTLIARITCLLYGIGNDSLSIVEIAKVIITASLIITLSAIPGGYGIKELSIVYFLGLEGISSADAMIVALSERTFQVFISLIAGVFSSLWFLKLNDK